MDVLIVNFNIIYLATCITESLLLRDGCVCGVDGGGGGGGGERMVWWKRT